MAENGVKIIRDIGAGVTPIAVGLILASNQTIIPLFPKIVHLLGGWAIAIVGVIDLFQRFAGK